MDKQTIHCSVHGCDYCNCEQNCCEKKEISVCNCSSEQEKEATMCNSFKERNRE